MSSLKIFLVLLYGCVSTQKAEKENINAAYESILRVASASYLNGDHATALKLYKRVLQHVPCHEIALQGAVDVSIASKQYKDALKLLKACGKAPPVLWAKVYIASDDLFTAKQLLENHLISNARDVKAIEMLGICYDLLLYHKKAQQCYYEVIKISPTRTVKNNLGLSLIFSKNYKKAISILESIHNPSTKVLHNIALAYGLSGNIEKSKAIFAESLDHKSVMNNMDFINDFRTC